MGQMLDARELDLLFAGENILLPTHPRALALATTSSASAGTATGGCETG